MTEQGSNGTGATRFPASILGEVRSRWPQLAIHAEPFVEYAQQRNVDLTAISDEIGADLYLAFACFSQFSGAIHAFYQCHAPRMRAVGRRFDESEFFADEILQRVSERLFVSSAHHPSGIGQYRGEAPLSAWVNTIARRVALRQGVWTTHGSRSGRLDGCRVAT